MIFNAKEETQKIITFIREYYKKYNLGGVVIGISGGKDSGVVAGLFAILLGDIGIHQFYLGNIGKGILCILFSWTGIPAIIGLIQGILILCESDDDFAKRMDIKDPITRLNTDDYYYDRSKEVKAAGSFAKFAQNYDLDVPEAIEFLKNYDKIPNGINKDKYIRYLKIM